MANGPIRTKFLFAMFQGGGNIPLLLPIVSRLVARGHDVKVLAGPGIRPRPIPITPRFRNGVEAAGATLLLFEEPEENPYVSAPPLRGLVGGWTPQRLRNMAVTEARTTLWSPAWARNTTRILRTDPPDVLVCDFLLLGAIAAGEAQGLPTACIVHNAFPPHVKAQPPKGLGLNPPRTPAQQLSQRFWRWARDSVWTREGNAFHNAARSELGLPPLKTLYQQYDSTDRMLVLGHEDFDFAAKMPPYVRYVGTPIDDAAVESWPGPWSSDDPRPLILVSMSTLPQGQVPVMQRLVQAVGEMPVRALVTIGPSLNRGDFEAASNTALETFVPHSAVMARVDVMITQCGLGSLTKALINSVPVLCLPLVGDQPDNAARAVAKGVAIRLSPDASVDAIKAGLGRLLKEPHFRKSAQALAKKMTATSAEDNAARELESLALHSQTSKVAM